MVDGARQISYYLVHAWSGSQRATVRIPRDTVLAAVALHVMARASGRFPYDVVILYEGKELKGRLSLESGQRVAHGEQIYVRLLPPGDCKPGATIDKGKLFFVKVDPPSAETPPPPPPAPAVVAAPPVKSPVDIIIGRSFLPFEHDPAKLMEYGPELLKTGRRVMGGGVVCAGGKEAAYARLCEWINCATTVLTDFLDQIAPLADGTRRLLPAAQWPATVSREAVDRIRAMHDLRRNMLTALPADEKKVNDPTPDLFTATIDIGQVFAYVRDREMKAATGRATTVTARPVPAPGPSPLPAPIRPARPQPPRVSITAEQSRTWTGLAGGKKLRVTIDWMNHLNRTESRRNLSRIGKDSVVYADLVETKQFLDWLAGDVTGSTQQAVLTEALPYRRMPEAKKAAIVDEARERCGRIIGSITAEKTPVMINFGAIIVISGNRFSGYGLTQLLAQSARIVGGEGIAAASPIEEIEYLTEAQHYLQNASFIGGGAIDHRTERLAETFPEAKLYSSAMLQPKAEMLNRAYRRTFAAIEAAWKKMGRPADGYRGGSRYMDLLLEADDAHSLAVAGNSFDYIGETLGLERGTKFARYLEWLLKLDQALAIRVINVEHYGAPKNAAESRALLEILRRDLPDYQALKGGPQIIKGRLVFPLDRFETALVNSERIRAAAARVFAVNREQFSTLSQEHPLVASVKNLGEKAAVLAGSGNFEIIGGLPADKLSDPDRQVLTIVADRCRELLSGLGDQLLAGVGPITITASQLEMLKAGQFIYLGRKIQNIVGKAEAVCGDNGGNLSDYRHMPGHGNVKEARFLALIADLFLVPERERELLLNNFPGSYSLALEDGNLVAAKVDEHIATLRRAREIIGRVLATFSGA